MAMSAKDALISGWLETAKVIKTTAEKSQEYALDASRLIIMFQEKRKIKGD